MRWWKKNKELINQIIDRYHWMLEKKSRTKKFFADFAGCPFCGKYHDKGWICLDSCPNLQINEILDICHEPCEFSCSANAIYIGLRLIDGGICRTSSNIKKRLRFWQDTFELTKKEFIKKYKKKEE